jgi:hypothetical protein
LWKPKTKRAERGLRARRGGPNAAAMYSRLRADLIVKTIDRLEARIAARFPESGLARLIADVARTARETGETATRLQRPYYWLRLLVALVVVAGLAAQVFSASLVKVQGLATDMVGMVQGLESSVNLLVLMGAGVWFLATLEERLKRQRALAALHALRSLAHVVDMHQLTKDPTAILLEAHLRTAASPERAMDAFKLTRYLEYCAEMLALIGKIAALIAEDMRDPVVIEAVNDVESLTTNLGRKIWQKITLIPDDRRAQANA